MGVTTTPEICEECKSHLRSAYAFRKKCLGTENLIGGFLKKSRCNAASIELIDVLIFLEQRNKDNKQEQTQKKVPQETTQVKAQIISEWDDDGSQNSEDSNEVKTAKVSLFDIKQVFSYINN